MVSAGPAPLPSARAEPVRASAPAITTTRPKTIKAATIATIFTKQQDDPQNQARLAPQALADDLADPRDVSPEHLKENLAACRSTSQIQSSSRSSRSAADRDHVPGDTSEHGTHVSFHPGGQGSEPQGPPSPGVPESRSKTCRQARKTP